MATPYEDLVRVGQRTMLYRDMFTRELAIKRNFKKTRY